ncbi:MAG: rod shape-determining protein MreD [Lachnospiraceae bacterium]|nr:rod shape-determining protein MreD [Lachnospiraceae bacterium]
MLRKITVFILILFSFILQSTVFRSLAFAGIVPNLMIIITSAFGFMRGENEGLIIGFFCGLLIDIFYGSILGFYALILMYIGYLNGKFNRIFYPEDIKLPIGLIIVSDLSYGMICYILLFLLKGKFHFLFYFKNIILPEVVYTIVVTCIMYPLILFINEKLEQREHRRRRGA